MTYLDGLVGLLVLIVFILWVFSKFTQQSIKDILIEIRDMLAEQKEEER